MKQEHPKSCNGDDSRREDQKFRLRFGGDAGWSAFRGIRRHACLQRVRVLCFVESLPKRHEIVLCKPSRHHIFDSAIGCIRIKFDHAFLAQSFQAPMRRRR